MGDMFRVRSSPCPACNLQSSPPLHAACAAIARHLQPPGPLLAPHRINIACPPFGSAVRVGVQPAAELRHVQRQKHAQHVSGALLPVPGLQSAVGPTPTCCLGHRRPLPSVSRPAPRPAPRPASYASFRLSAGRIGVQPATELRHVQRQIHEQHVPRALFPGPCPQSAVEPSPARCLHRRRPRPSCLTGPHLAPHRMPSFRLSAGRVEVQPAAELRHVQRQKHGAHVPSALLPVPGLPVCSRSKPLHAACTAVARGPPTPRPASRPTSYTLRSTLDRMRGSSTSR